MQDGTPSCNANSLMMMTSDRAAYVVGYTIYIMDISELWAYAWEGLSVLTEGLSRKEDEP